jgi:phytanoyl-CoA hydroxylase
MHNLLLHGSGPNLSDQPRTLFIAEYRSDDAIPLATSHIPSRHEGELVRGEASDTVRTADFTMRIPPVPKTASFFNQQARIDLVDEATADVDIDLRADDADELVLE